MTSTPPASSTPTPDASDLDRNSFERTAAARAAMKLIEAPQFTLHAYHACGKALAILPAIAPYRAEMVALPGFDVAHLDWLEHYARALRYVQTELLLRVQQASRSPVLANEGYPLRALMMSFADTLSLKGLVAPEILVRLRQGSGYRDLAEDLNVLAQLLLKLPPEWTGPSSAVTRAEINRASQIAQEMNVIVGNVVNIDLSQDALIEERQKLGGLLLRAHSQIRRAISYLRWDAGDAAALVPTLFVAGGARKAAAEEQAPEGLAELHEHLHEQETKLAPEDDPFTKE